jgi:hypothetical protein
MFFPTHIFGGGWTRNTGRQNDVGPDWRFLINTELHSATAPSVAAELPSEVKK